MKSRKPGKLVVKRFYVHKSALDAKTKAKVDKAQKLVPDWEWEIARIDCSSGQIALIQSPDWDIADEPTVGEMRIIERNTVKERHVKGMIYHHKWLFVSDTYTGFNVEKSKARSKLWESLDPPVNKKMIGRRSYWESEVLPRLSNG